MWWFILTVTFVAAIGRELLGLISEKQFENILTAAWTAVVYTAILKLCYHILRDIIASLMNDSLHEELFPRHYAASKTHAASRKLRAKAYRTYYTDAEIFNENMLKAGTCLGIFLLWVTATLYLTIYAQSGNVSGWLAGMALISGCTAAVCFMQFRRYRTLTRAQYVDRFYTEYDEQKIRLGTRDYLNIQTRTTPQ